MQRAVELLKGSSGLAIVGGILSIFCVFLAAKFGEHVNVIILGALFAILSYYPIDKNPVYGILILMASTFMLPIGARIFRLDDMPVTTFIEAINVIFFIALALKGRLRGGNTFIGILVLIWFFLELGEVVNPNANSRIASVFAFRIVIMFTMAFFASYSAIRTKRDLYVFIHGWIGMVLIAALYGYYQEFVGLPSWDYEWATSSEFHYKLLFTWGRLRKFGFFTSPGEFAQVMVYGGTACLILAFMPRMSPFRRGLLFLSALIMFVAMTFSGSRTAMIMLTVGFFVFAAITLKRSVLIVVAIMAMVGSVLIFKSYSVKALHVMKTAFEGTEDASMKVRIANQRVLRDYIKRNPVGFGLGSIGFYGVKYSGHTFIGSFPPDSEYVKIAVDNGWVGFTVWMILQILIFCWGINAYFSIKDWELKDLMVIPLVWFFMIIIAQYPQEFFRAPVQAILWAVCVAMIAKIKSLDSSGKSAVVAEEDLA